MTKRFHLAAPRPLRLAIALASALLVLAAGNLAAEPGGGSWVPISPDLGTVTALAFDPQGGGTAYAAFANGLVFVSADRGATWSQVSVIAATSGPVVCLAVSPGDPKVVYACTTAGLLRSLDGGATWAKLRGAGIDVRQVAIAPSDPLTLYAGSNGGTDNDRGGLFRSTDGGKTWTPVTPSLFSVNVLAVDPSDPATVYLGGSSFWSSHDGGATWTQADPLSLAFNGVVQILIDRQAPTTLYALTSGGAAGFLLRSTDGGSTWSQFGPNALAVGLSGSGSLYAVDEFASVFRSRRASQPWRRLSSLNAALDPALAANEDFPLTVFAVDPGSEVMLVGIDTEGLIRSSGGLSFSPPAGLAALSVPALLHVSAPAKGAPGRLFAVTVSDGRDSPESTAPRNVFASEEGTASWHLLSLNSPPSVGLSAGLDDALLAFDPTAGVLYLYDGLVSSFLVSADRGQSWSRVTSASLPVELDDLVAVPGSAGKLFGLSASVANLPPHPAEYLTVAASQDGGLTWSVGTTYLAPAPPGVLLSNPPPLTARLLPDPADPSHVYVAATQLLESTDGGMTLTPLPLPGALAVAALDPISPRTLYAALVPAAGATGAMLYKSSNGGASWRSAAHGLPVGATASALAVDPSAHSTVYLATDRGVFVTQNAGGSWTALSGGLSGLHVISFAFAPGPPARIYAGTDSAGVFVLDP